MIQTTEKPKPIKPVKQGKYSSLTDLVRGVSEDKKFADQTISKIQERSIVDFLMGLRAAKGLSQSDIAKKMACTQSRISKLENGKDDDLRIGDLRDYCKAIGLEFSLLLSRQQGNTLVHQVKQHSLAIRKLLHRIASLSKNDKAMEEGIKKFFFEALANTAISVITACQRLDKEIASAKKNGAIPELPPETLPVIRCDDGTEEKSDNEDVQSDLKEECLV